MNIDEYLKNPYGKGSAFASKEKQKQLDAEFLTNKNKFHCIIYLYHKRVIYHVIIPSKSNSTTSYDVVIEADLSKVHEGDATISRVPINVFSNSPSFIFTYANVMKKNDMIPKWLLNKYDKKVKTLSPSIRNTYEIIGLERSIYLSLKYIHLEGKDTLAVINSTAKKITNLSIVSKNIRSQEVILNNRKSATIKKEENINTHTVEKKKENKKISKPKLKVSKTPKEKKTNKSPKIKKTKTENYIKKI